MAQQGRLSASVSARPTTSKRRLPGATNRDTSKGRRKSPVQGAATTPEPVGPIYRVASYTVYPSNFDEFEGAAKEQWCLSVVDAGNGWAIRRGDMCLNIAMQWEQERATVLCDGHFLRRCRYNEHAALLRARRVVDRLEVGGMTFDEYVSTLATPPAD
ncbi:MAG TPA: hypothetical protein VGE38_10045 [Nocardioides sp.]|uniref:hypothetical protein n=1 Tax=Nocardioides sp. TaxID=35761 RepID=UPI002EDB80F1